MILSIFCKLYCFIRARLFILICRTSSVFFHIRRSFSLPEYIPPADPRLPNNRFLHFLPDLCFPEFCCTLPEPRKPSLPSVLPEVPPAWTGTQTRLLPDRVLPHLSEIPTVSHDLPNDISGSTAAVPAFFLPVRK